MIDLHCHLLPGIDDGPRDLAAAVDLARAFVDEGVTVVAATPHVSPDHPNTYATIAATRSRVSDALAQEGIALQVVPGAELDLLHIAELSGTELEALQLGTSGTVLIECPFSAAAPFFEERIARLQAAGLQVLLAHPERSPAFTRDPPLLDRLVGRGAMVSLTASSFAGRFGKPAKKYAAWALDAGLVHDVASDAHNTGRRPPVLRAPLEAAGYGWAVPWLTQEAPAALLAGAALPPRPKPPRRWGRPRARRGA